MVLFYEFVGNNANEKVQPIISINEDSLNSNASEACQDEDLVNEERESSNDIPNVINQDSSVGSQDEESSFNPCNSL